MRYRSCILGPGNKRAGENELQVQVGQVREQCIELFVATR